jgi:hypothetical protein
LPGANGATIFREIHVRKAAAQSILFAIVLSPLMFAQAVAFDLQTNKEDVRRALEVYTSCNGSCALDLAEKIGNESVDLGLETVGFLASARSTDVSKRVKVVMFYALMRSAYERSKKVISTHAVCTNKCDELNQEIVTLGRAGLLGPMTRGEQVNEAALNKPEIWNAYLRFVKPVQLPAEHRGERWWRHIESLS